MGNFGDMVVGFLFDKTAEKGFAWLGDKRQERAIRDKIKAYADQYFANCFVMLPDVKSFDFQGLNAFIEEQLFEDIQQCLIVPNHERRKRAQETLVARAAAAAQTKNEQQRKIVSLYVEMILNIVHEHLYREGNPQAIANTITDETIAGFTQLLDQKISSALPMAPELPHWLTIPCTALSPKYIKRAEYTDFSTIVRDHKKVLLHGMGGIGKTECMRAACEQLSDSYTHVAWIQYTDSLESSLVAQICIDGLDGLSFTEKSNKIQRLLVRFGKDLLLFVDNIDRNAVDDKSIRLLGRLEGTVIATARREQLLSEFEPLQVDYLGVEECKQLLYRYSSHSKEEDETVLERIVTLAGRHTLALEIIAKMVRARKKSFQEMETMLLASDFHINIPVITAHSDDIPENLMMQLRKLYKLSNIVGNVTYAHILKCFSILPYLPLSKEDAIAFLELDAQREQAIYELAEEGWLEFTEMGFAMHPVIQKLVSEAKRTLDDCREFIVKLLHAAGKDFFTGMAYRPMLNSVANVFSNIDTLIGNIYYYLSWIYHDLGNLQEALRWQEKAKLIRETLFPEGIHPDLAQTYNNLSEIYHDMGELSEALKWLLKAKEIGETLFPEGLHSSLSATYNNYSEILRDMGNLPEALKWQEKAKAILEVLFPDGMNPSLAITYSNLSLIYHGMGDLPEAMKWLEKAKKIKETLYSDGLHPDLAVTYSNLSGINSDMGNLPDALYWQEKAKEIRETLFPDGIHPDLAMTYNNLSGIYRYMGNLPKALKLQEKALSIWEMLFPEGVHLNLATTYNNFSLIYSRMGNLPEALRWQQKAQVIMEALFPNGVHPKLSTTYNNLAEIYRDMMNLSEAMKWQKKAKTILEILFPNGIHPDLATTYSNLSLICSGMGNMQEALKWQEKANSILETLFPEGTHPSLATNYNNFSYIYLVLGNLLVALMYQEKAKTIWEKLFPNGVHPNLAMTYNNLSGIYGRMGNQSKALEMLEKARRIMEALFPDGIHPNLATTYGNMAEIFHAMGESEQADHWSQMAQKVQDKLVERDRAYKATN